MTLQPKPTHPSAALPAGREREATRIAVPVSQNYGDRLDSLPNPAGTSEKPIYRKLSETHRVALAQLVADLYAPFARGINLGNGAGHQLALLVGSIEDSHPYCLKHGCRIILHSTPRPITHPPTG